MAIRKIVYTVNINGISPAAVQRAGLQGEHNATTLEFNISQELAEALFEKSSKDKLVYRIEAHTGTGEKNSTLPEDVVISDGRIKEFTLNYGLENWLTRGGGNISVYLIFSILAADETLIDIYSYPARLKLESVPDGRYTDGQNYESVAKLSVAATEAAERAEAASDEAEEAKEKTLAAEKVLTEGTFIFLGGDAKGGGWVELVVDTELSEYSENPISNKAAAAAIRKVREQHMLEWESLFANIAKNAADIEKNAQYFNAFVDTFADYPIEIGKSGIWTYEKYKSGKCRLWGKTEATANITDAFGAVYRSKLAYFEELPFVFAEPPVCLCDMSAKGNWAVSKFSNETSTKNRTCSVYASRPEGVSGTAVPIVIHWEVIGQLETEE